LSIREYPWFCSKTQHHYTADRRDFPRLIAVAYGLALSPFIRVTTKIAPQGAWSPNRVADCDGCRIAMKYTSMGLTTQ
jgi:hypothetical protein